MFTNFEENRKYIEHEFEHAQWDASTGMNPSEIEAELQRMYDNSTEPMPILRAKMYEFVLDNAQIEINPKTPFSAKFNIGVNYDNFATQDYIQHTIYITQRGKVRKNILTDEEYFKQSNLRKCGYGLANTDFWHTVPDWNNVIKLGISGLLKKAEKLRAESDNYSQEQIQFLDSVLICYRAMIRMMHRIHKESLKYDIGEFSECILNLTQRAPETLYEVLQTAVLFLYFEEIGPERARSLGPVDRLYLPFFKSDLKNGKTIEEEKELFRYFFIHFTATKRYAQQPMLVGGSDCDGNDLCNELTELILEVYDELNILDPKIHVRYNKEMPDKILCKVLDMIRHGNSSICIMNDEAVYKAYDKMNIPREDSQHYVPLGCYEPIIMGMEEAEIGASWFNIVKPLEFVFNNGCDIITGLKLGLDSKENIETFEEFLNEYYKQLDGCIDFLIEVINKEGEHSTEISPAPIYSSTFTECLEKATDIHQYSAKYNNMSIKLMGLATLTDSVYAMKKYVYDSKEISYADMKKAILTNWEGYEDLRLKISADGEKYGNNEDGPDEILKAITKHITDKYAYKKLPRGGVLRLGTDSIDYCRFWGKKTSATPNGRKIGDVLSKNLCAEVGKDKNGLLSYMQTVLKIDATDFVDSATLDFMLHPSAVSREKGLRDFKNVIKTFFAYGGFALQGNVVSADTLKQAMIEPEKYSTLQIRVCGWNEYFVKMNKEMQKMFIADYSEN